jgi:hypothetical protein
MKQQVEQLAAKVTDEASDADVLEHVKYAIEEGTKLLRQNIGALDKGSAEGVGKTIAYFEAVAQNIHRHLDGGTETSAAKDEDTSSTSTGRKYKGKKAPASE